jgi:hypothetical protein
MNSGYGPDCPTCQKSAEWTQREIDESVYAPRTYCCNHCYTFYVLDIDEIVNYQQQAQELLARYDGPQTETEEDWKKAREEWNRTD